jgi:hypothetical protein
MEQIKAYGPAIAGAVGTTLSAKGEVDSGNAIDKVMRYRAKQMEQNAGQEEAAASVAAQEEQRKSALIASRAMAVAAASGGGALDPTVVKILQGIAGEGELATQMQLYNGRERARGMRDQAKASRYEGALNKIAGRKKALTTILGGVSQAANTWGSSTDRPKTALSNVGFSFDGKVDDNYDRVVA